MLGDLSKDGLIGEYSDICNRYNLPLSHFLKFLQIRNWIEDQCKDYPRIGDTPLRKIIHLYDSPTGLISKLYKWINDCVDHKHLNLKYKWEKDLNANYSNQEWETILWNSQTFLTSTKHRLIQFNVLHRTYYTPHRLYHMYQSVSSCCPRCTTRDGTLTHMLWDCKSLQPFWQGIHNILSKMLQKTVTADPLVAILGDLNRLHNFTLYQKKLILLSIAATKKCILTNWKSTTPPSLKQWWNEILSYCTPEKKMHSVRGKPEHFFNIWGPLMKTIPQIEASIG